MCSVDEDIPAHVLHGLVFNKDGIVNARPAALGDGEPITMSMPDSSMQKRNTCLLSSARICHDL